MIFTDVRFAVLLLASWLSFFAAPVRLRTAVLAGWGVVFYAIYAREYLPLVGELILVAYLFARGRPDVVLALLVAMLFGRFKLGADLTGLSQASATLAPTAIIVPLGFSFLAFELLHFVIEVRRGRIARISLVDLLAFAFFFPCRIAGPIKRYPAFLEAVQTAVPSTANVYAGLVRILTGLFKKVVVADILALTVREIEYAATPLHLWKVVLAYSVQILLDFSAYSDLAIGTSRLLGIAVPENFRWPYLSPNIQEFWNRWHITLSSWARDYVFTPSGRQLFKTRLRSSPTAIAALSYLATFLVIGAWHGLTPNYLLWGLYHGLLLTAYYVYRKSLPAWVATSRVFHSRVVHVAGTALTFFLVTIGWLPFLTDFSRTTRFMRIMFGLSS